MRQTPHSSGRYRRHHSGVVLIAEDDDDLRAAMVEALRGDGYLVVGVSDGAEAAGYLADVVGNPDAAPMPDVLICDVRMPRCDGLELLSRLQGSARGLPAILVTAYATGQLEADAHRLGAAYVFEKPFELDDLRTAVANVEYHQRIASKIVDPLPTEW